MKFYRGLVLIVTIFILGCLFFLIFGKQSLEFISDYREVWNSDDFDAFSKKAVREHPNVEYYMGQRFEHTGKCGLFASSTNLIKYKHDKRGGHVLNEREIIKLSEEEDVQKGYPDGNKKCHRIVNGKMVCVTWCNRLVMRVLSKDGILYKEFLEPDGVDYTCAADLIDNLIGCCQNGSHRVRRLDGLDQFLVENKSIDPKIRIIAGQYNASGPSHVAVVTGIKDNVVYVVQAGLKNGLMTLRDGFGSTSNIIFFLIPAETNS